MTFGDYLAAAIEAAGFPSNAEFARATGVTTSSISKWRNNIETPSVEMLRRIAPALEADLLELLVRAEILTWKEAHLTGPLAPPKERTFEARIAELQMSDEARRVVLQEFERMQRIRAGRRSARRDDDDAEDARRSA